MSKKRAVHDASWAVVGAAVLSFWALPSWAQPFAFTTLAGKAGVGGGGNGTGAEALFIAPTGITAKNGWIYTTEYRNGWIRKISRAGIVTTLAGNPRPQNDGSTDGTGSDARFFHAHGLTVDNQGNVYVCDYGNSTIRKVSAKGVVTTVAGKAGQEGTADGKGPTARFTRPEGIAVNRDGTLYVADTFNNTIRKITPTGGVTTFAGTAGAAGSADGKGAAARFDVPIGIAIDPAGNLYVADGGYDTQKGNSTIRKISPSGVVTTLAGLAGSLGTTDGTGTTARFHFPVGITVDKNGTVFIADTHSNTIRQISPQGVVTTVAGAPGIAGAVDGTGTNARFNQPQSLVVDDDGTLYVADTYSNTIRKGVRAEANPARTP